MTKNEICWEISVLKNKLKATDYKAIKHSEGLISDDDYEEIKTQREEWREAINNYEEMIANEEYDEEVYVDDVDVDIDSNIDGEGGIDDTDDIDSLSNGDGIEEEATDET